MAVDALDPGRDGDYPYFPRDAQGRPLWSDSAPAVGRPEVGNVRGSYVPATGATIIPERDEGTVTMAKMTSETDARTDEYATFAPAGETCPECEQPFGSLEVCRRGTVERQSGPPVVVYRHPKCAAPFRRDR